MYSDCCFVTSCDSNYFQGALSLISSIRCFSNFPIVFLDAGITKAQQEQLKSRVDKVVDITELLNDFSSLKIVHKHLKISALASLFSHYSGYERQIYMDVDTLLLGKVDFVFNFLRDFDIVGVRAGVRSTLESSISHSMRDEIAPESLDIFRSIFPGLKLDGLCLNTGFVGVNSSVLKDWEKNYQSLFQYMEHYKFVDQSIFNLLLNSFSNSIKELHWSYNFAGISDSLDESKSSFSFVATKSLPQFLYQANYQANFIKVPHFSGKPKPWELQNQSPGFKIWNHFSSMHYNQSDSSIKDINIILDESWFIQDEINAKNKFEIIDRHLGNNLNIKNSKNLVLGLGSSSASFLRLMQAAGFKAFCLEQSNIDLKAIQERYGFEIKKSILKKTEFSQKFNLVATFDSIEYAKNPIACLSDINYLLEIGGYLFVECQSIERWYSGILDFSLDDICLITLSEKVIFSLLDKAGFQIIDSGWNGIILWVIAKKVSPDIISVASNDIDVIKTIIQETVSKSDGSYHKASKLGSFASLTQRGLTLAKKSPLQIPSKILAKVKKRFGMTANPLDAQNIALKPHKILAKSLKIAHVGLHGNGNAGDTLLFPAVRWLFQKEVCPTHFTLIPLREPVTQDTIAQINQQDALVIGGGGLFLADSNPNERSGWQWACPIELLKQIKVPIILFAVGYNQFRGQKNFAPIFEQNVQLLIEKSAFVGIRNRGSIEALKDYLPESLHEKIHYQPCPTTVLRHFYPDLPQHTEASKPILAVNIAFDRHHLRFGKREDEILWNMADAFLELKSQGWQIKLFNHVSIDGDARYWFRARGLFAEEVNIGSVPPVDILHEYSQATIAVGMRGHAQMIPFGLHRPIYSLISHDKLQFFLDDIGHSDWGVEVQDPTISEKLIHDLNDIYTNLPHRETQLETAQSKLWSLTQQNLDLIKKVLNV
ncbi:MAG: polysaccharide pyruvyl transferase family protein [Xenococcaceae cyanobacterium MO_188.B32]|nr:polysaccharide pyruvyl transferase family protein [Xenococcaceae cyanobacterium MO_188.B32]